ncbi:hypothetical protein F5879DRAFT_156007 [Lentinula edodes]|nr:hypothetical protein F5879DRAFT_156007 [Lentinula edodes]
MTAQSSSFVDYTPFLTHLVVLLSIYEKPIPAKQRQRRTPGHVSPSNPHSVPLTPHCDGQSTAPMLDANWSLEIVPQTTATSTITVLPTNASPTGALSTSNGSIPLSSPQVTQPLPPTASIPLPSYTGPSDWRTDSILRSLSVVVGRMHQAEMQNASSKLHSKFANGTGIPSMVNGVSDSVRSTSRLNNEHGDGTLDLDSPKVTPATSAPALNTFGRRSPSPSTIANFRTSVAATNGAAGMLSSGSLSARRAAQGLATPGRHTASSSISSTSSVIASSHNILSSTTSHIGRQPASAASRTSSPQTIASPFSPIILGEHGEKQLPASAQTSSTPTPESGNSVSSKAVSRSTSVHSSDTEGSDATYETAYDTVQPAHNVHFTGPTDSDSS